MDSLSTDRVSVLVIGAGPAGLAICGRLSKLGVDYTVIEKGSTVAPAWHQHYERVHLHTIKEYSWLPHGPFPRDYPCYVPRRKLVDYYQAYADRMGIRPKFGQEVKRIARDGDQWKVDTTAGGFLADTVVVATGFNRKPKIPTWPGMERYRGEILHSRFYRRGSDFSGKRVLVVGMGNTGAEIALDLHEQGAKAALSVRGPVNVVPRDFMGNPTQKSAMMLNYLPMRFGDAMGTMLQKLTVGDLSKYGLEKPPYPPAYQQRKFGKTPVIDVGTIAEIKRGNILVYPGIERFEEATVAFADGRKEGFDGVVLATGYKVGLKDFIADTTGLFNENGAPSACWYDNHPGLFFLGYNAYASGLLWSIHCDSKEIAERILDRTNRLNRQGSRHDMSTQVTH